MSNFSTNLIHTLTPIGRQSSLNVNFGWWWIGILFSFIEFSGRLLTEKMLLVSSAQSMKNLLHKVRISNPQHFQSPQFLHKLQPISSFPSKITLQSLSSTQQNVPANSHSLGITLSVVPARILPTVNVLLLQGFTFLELHKNYPKFA